MPRLAVIGFPVGHSRSPAMQNAALEALGLAPDWSYGAIKAAPEDFESTVRELAASGYTGVNVTVPHKEAALALADEASDAARRIGAANTLSFAADHNAIDDVEARPWIVAENTDAGGLLAALPAALAADGRALVLGAGGAARAAIWALGDAGGSELDPDDAGSSELDPGDGAARFGVDVWNRTGARAATVAAELGAKAVENPAPDEYDLIVNTTSVGLRGEDPFEHLPLRAADLSSRQTVVDMVYGERPSELLVVAEAAGATVVDGLEVLVRQGALSLRIWTGREAPIEAMRAAARG